MAQEGCEIGNERPAEEDVGRASFYVSVVSVPGAGFVRKEGDQRERDGTSKCKITSSLWASASGGACF